MSGLGPKADLTARKSDFRSSPESGLRADIAPCPVRAITGSRDYQHRVRSCKIMLRIHLRPNAPIRATKHANEFWLFSSWSSRSFKVFKSPK